AIAVATIAVRWITTAPHRATLATGRIAGLGAATLIAAAAFVPAAGTTLDARTALAGGCLAAGTATLLGLLPLGGWAAASTGLVRGADVAPWALLVAPTVLLGALALLPALPAGARNPFANVLLVMGLLSAVWGGLMALRTPEPARYGRVLLADLALAAAGLGSTHGPGRLGCFVLVLTHLGAAPLLLQSARSALDRQRRLAWLGLCGLPPTPAFWGRYLVLLGLSAANADALLLGLVASAALTGTAAPALAGGWPPVAAAACAVFAAALLPLPGSPATSLPGRTGPTANLLGMLLLLAAAVVLTGPPRWPARRLVLAGAATLPALVLAAAAATFSLPVI